MRRTGELLLDSCQTKARLFSTRQAPAPAMNPREFFLNPADYGLPTRDELVAYRIWDTHFHGFNVTARPCSDAHRIRKLFRGGALQQMDRITDGPCAEAGSTPVHLQSAR